jgi:pimeloyl-ACP methyl ester carboxylesterase
MIARLLLALMLCASSPSFANEPNRFALTHTAAERFEIGATLVERHGAGPVSVILIPGLASGPWAWQDALADLKKDHTVYVLTLPGFDGRPAVEGKGIGAAQESLRELIAARKLDRPVLIGHSLGGTLSIGFAAQYPDLVRGVVSLDGEGKEAHDVAARDGLARRIVDQAVAPDGRRQHARALVREQVQAAAALMRARRNSLRRLSAFGQSKSARSANAAARPPATPCRRRMKGRTNSRKVTKLDTGLPGRPRKKA